MKVTAKITAKANEEAANCYAMAENIEKLTCAINQAGAVALEGNGSATRFILGHAVAEAYELAVRHPEKKQEFESLGVSLRHIARYAKPKLSPKSADKLRAKLIRLQDAIPRLRANVRARCHVPYVSKDRF